MDTCTKSLDRLFGFSLNTDGELGGLGFILLSSGVSLLLSSTVLQPLCSLAKTKLLEQGLGCLNIFLGGIFSPTIREGATENVEKDTN